MKRLYSLLLLAVLACAPVDAATGSYIPAVPSQYFTDAGAPAASYRIFTYLAGTTTKTTTYTNQALGASNTNPIVLDSAGRATIFLDPSISYKFVFCAPGSDDPPSASIWTRDNIAAVPNTNVALDTPGTAGENLSAGNVVYLSDGSGGTTAGRWYKADADNTYSSTQAPSIGMMMANLNTGVLGSIRLQGQVTGLSALTAGTTYYVSATAGALTSTAPGNAQLVGTADSTTSLILSNTTKAGSAFAQTVGNVNLLADPTFLIWPAGDAAAPAHWSVTGAGVAIARSGTGLGSTVRKVGDFAAQVTQAAATATIQQQLLPAASFTRFSFLQGQSVSAGAWLRGTTNNCTISISDGVGTSTSAAVTPDATFHWVTVTRTLDLSATNLVFAMTVGTNGATCYLSGPTMVLGPIPPAYYQPAPMHYETVNLYIAGVQTVGTDKVRHLFPRPAIVKDVQLIIKTAPTGAALIVDVNSWDGAAFTSIYSTRPQIAAAATTGGAQPDSTYARRCFTLYTGSGAAAAGSYLSVDVDQIGSGVAGSDLWVFVRYLMYNRPLEEALGYSDIN